MKLIDFKGLRYSSEDRNGLQVVTLDPGQYFSPRAKLADAIIKKHQQMLRHETHPKQDTNPQYTSETTPSGLVIMKKVYRS